MCKWFSGRARTGRAGPHIELGDIREFMEIDQFEWEGYLDTEESEGELNAIRGNTMQGMPYGEKEFMDTIGKKVGISLRVFARGRPKKAGNMVISVCHQLHLTLQNTTVDKSF